MKFFQQTINYIKFMKVLIGRNCILNHTNNICPHEGHNNKFLTRFTPSVTKTNKMLEMKTYRNAQTQHGDESVDEENIVVLKSEISAELHPLPVRPSDPLKESTTSLKSNEEDCEVVEAKLNNKVLEDAEATQCVWFYEVEPLAKRRDSDEIISPCDKEKLKIQNPEKRKAEDTEQLKDLKKAKLETKALKAKRPGFTDERYHETSYYIENGLRKVYPYYFTFTTFTKGRWVGEKILDVFAREFRAHPAEEYERCITTGTLTVNYEKVPIDYRLKHNDLLANIVHRHEVPVTSQPITIVHLDEDIVVVNKPASIPVHPCGRYRHNTVVFILAKEYNLKNLRTIHRLDRLTSGLLLFGRSPKKARQMEHQIRNRLVRKEYICRVEGEFPEGTIECKEPIEVVSYKIGVCKVSTRGKECRTTFQRIAHNGKTSVVLCKPHTGRMHQIRVHLQYLGYPVVNDPLYNHEVFGPLKGRGGDIGGKTDEQLVNDLIHIHNAENWLGIDSDSEMSLFKTIKGECDGESLSLAGVGSKGTSLSDDDSETVSRETSPCSESPRPAAIAIDGENSAENNSYSVAIPVPTILDNVSVNPKAPNSVATMVMNGTSTGFSTGATAALTASHVKVTVATQTGHESPDMAFNAEKMTADKHCYECKVRYRDPKPKDLVMYLHAWTYKGPGWEYETELPAWASNDWVEPE